MKFFSVTYLIIFLLIGKSAGFSQGFVNLNFENAVITADTSQGNPFIYATNAIPNWTAYVNGVSQSDVIYDTINIDEPSVSIHDTNSFIIQPLQGKFSVFLQGGTQYAGDVTNSAIGQIGQIPLSAESLTYWGANYNILQITFAGQLLSFSAIGSTANYTIYGANILAYAGQTGQLLFTASQLGGGIIDNIQFSSLPVPEPNILGLFVLGGLFYYVFGKILNSKIYCNCGGRGVKTFSVKPLELAAPE